MMETLVKGTLGFTLGSIWTVSAAFGQSINVDFGQPDVGPPSTYAGAGLPGVWNSIEGEHTPFSNPQVIYDLVGLEGQQTGVTLYQFGGQELIDVEDTSLTGDENGLMRDALVTHSSQLETCLWINGLQNGTYEVLTYGWMPNHPEIFKKSDLISIQTYCSSAEHGPEHRLRVSLTHDIFRKSRMDS